NTRKGDGALPEERPIRVSNVDRAFAKGGTRIRDYEAEAEGIALPVSAAVAEVPPVPPVSAGFLSPPQATMSAAPKIPTATTIRNRFITSLRGGRADGPRKGLKRGRAATYTRKPA